jgi:glucosamine kinase
MSGGETIIGIDGGGTSCRFALLHDGLRTEVVRGPANVSTDRHSALATLDSGLRDLVREAGLDDRALERARLYAGLAGVLTPGIAADVAAALPVVRAVVTDDRPTTMRGALGDGDGTVAAIGTGSFFGRRAGGRQRFIGGWGYQLGDEASGAWLGRHLLAAVLHAEDAIRTQTPLTRAILSRHENDPARLVEFARKASPADMAQIAAEIAAAPSDALAQELLARGAAWVRRAAEALGWTPGETLCLLGGVGPLYASLLDAPVTPPAGTALDGALALAAEIA